MDATDIGKKGRIHDRSRPAFRINVHLTGTSDIRAGEVVNIGSGGMFLALRFPLPAMGTEIQFKISLNDVNNLPLDLEGRAKVRWIRTESKDNLPTGCGVEFTFLTDDSSENLKKLLLIIKPDTFIPNR